MLRNGSDKTTRYVPPARGAPRTPGGGECPPIRASATGAGFLTRGPPRGSRSPRPGGAQEPQGVEPRTRPRFAPGLALCPWKRAPEPPREPTDSGSVKGTTPGRLLGRASAGLTKTEICHPRRWHARPVRLSGSARGPAERRSRRALSPLLPLGLRRASGPVPLGSERRNRRASQRTVAASKETGPADFSAGRRGPRAQRHAAVSSRGATAVGRIEGVCARPGGAQEPSGVEPLAPARFAPGLALCPLEASAGTAARAN